MSANTKLLLAMVFVVLLPFAVYTAYSYIALQSTADTIGENQLKLEEDAIHSLLHSQHSSIEAMATDYSQWDEMSAYVDDPDSQWLYDNVLSSLGMFGIDLFSVYDTSGKMITSTHPDVHLESAYPESFQEGAFSSSREPITGYVSTEDGLFLVSVAPILHSNATGPFNGLLVVGYELNDEWIGRCSEMTNVHFTLSPTGSASRGGDEVLYDIASKPVAMLSIASHCEPMEIIGTVLSRWLWTTVLLGVVGILVVCMMVHGMMVLPLRRLGANMRRRVEKGETTTPIEPMGNRDIDEVIEQLNYIVEKHGKSIERLNSAYDDLKALDELKSEYITVVSHEARTPLAVAMGNLELMLGGAFGGLTDAQKVRLKLVLEKHDELKGLINRLSLLAEMEAKELTPDYETVDIKALLEELVQSITPMAHSNDQKLKLFVPDGLPQIQADRNLLSSAIMELLQNCVVHSGRGTKIELSAMPHEDNLIKIDIRDNGVGIPPSTMKCIFEPLTAPVPSARVGSSALGLCIVKGIMDAHKGILEIESTEGKGTVYTMLIPIRPEHEI